MYRLSIIFAACVFVTSVVAADFKPHENGRFGYVIDLPSDFKTVQMPGNGDGRFSQAERHVVSPCKPSEAGAALCWTTLTT